jgi:oligoribonuclease NrnB/cAMP/cGMP phosphodiesterase (DHH superfamily)
MSTIIIYHANCNDGFCSAWVASKRFPDAIFHPAIHGDPPPDVTGHDVYIIDFSYPREDLIRMNNCCKSLLVLDHHKTAQAALKGLDFCVFDMEQSGAGLAWKWLGKYDDYDDPVPLLVQYVEDKDLWRFKLDNSREFNCVIGSYPMTFEAWDTLNRRLNCGYMGLSEIVNEGTAILRYQQQMVTNICKYSHEIDLAGYKVLCVNTPMLQSETANYLSIGRPFGVTWFENKDGDKIYSLRSKEDGIDVSEIAKKFGGGGHFHSAGFKLPK